MKLHSTNLKQQIFFYVTHLCLFYMSELWLSKSWRGGACSLVGRYHRFDGIFCLHLQCINTIEIREEVTYLPNHKNATQKDNLTELGPPNNIEALQLISYMIRRMYKPNCQSRWPYGLRRGSAVAILLIPRVRIPQRSCLFVCFVCCVLSRYGFCDELITRSQESYRLLCVI